MVLLALAHAASWSTRKVPYEDIVLQAWRDFPGEFSLRNHPEHPDASDIHKRIYQTLRPKGFAVSLGNKVFRLTDLGLDNARELDSSLKTSAPPAPRARLARNEQAFLEQVLGSRAFSTWMSGESDRLIEHDARIFFQFSTGTPIAERRLRVKFADETLAKAEALDVHSARDLAALSAFLKDGFHNLLEDEGGGPRAD